MVHYSSYISINKIASMLSISSRNLRSCSNLGTKQRERNYGIHVKRIEEIINKESRIKEMKKDHTRIVQILQKSKDISRKFRIQEDIRHRMNENTKMLCALIDIKMKPRMLTEWKKMDESIELRKSRTPRKDKCQQEEIKTNNIKIIDTFIDHSTSIKKYKKKIKGEIDEYLKRRHHLQKMRTVESLPLPRKKQKKHSPAPIPPLFPSQQNPEKPSTPSKG